jgi:excisionase family DNA binding protein
MSENVLERLLTPQEVSEALQVHRGSVYRWIREGRLPAKRMTGRQFRIRREDVQELFDEP